MSTKAKHIKLKEGFLGIYEEYADALFRYSFFKLSDKEKAKDLVQDVFYKAWDYLAAGKEIDNLKSFLYKTASNMIIDHYRKSKSESLDNLTDAGLDFADEISSSSEDMADANRALKLLNKLEPEIRDVLIMRYVEGLSVKEIADITGQRENTISVKVHRALNDLRGMFSGGLNDDGI